LADDELGEPCQHAVTDARTGGADDRHPLSEESARHEQKSLLRRLVEPLRVLDNTDEWLVLRDVGEERQGREPNEKPVWRRALAQP
jgi:hypothetical protein